MKTNVHSAPPPPSKEVGYWCLVFMWAQDFRQIVWECPERFEVTWMQRGSTKSVTHTSCRTEADLAFPGPSVLPSRGPWQAGFVSTTRFHNEQIQSNSLEAIRERTGDCSCYVPSCSAGVQPTFKISTCLSWGKPLDLISLGWTYRSLSQCGRPFLSVVSGVPFPQPDHL